MNQLAELRNLSIMNSKRIANIEKMINNLRENVIENKNLLDLVNDLNYPKNKNQDFYNLDYLQDIFSHLNQSPSDFIIDTDEELPLIPDDFFTET